MTVHAPPCNDPRGHLWKAISEHTSQCRRCGECITDTPVVRGTDLAALARDALNEHREPHRTDKYMKHQEAWTPERALAALAIIEQARYTDTWKNPLMKKALDHWDALP